MITTLTSDEWFRLVIEAAPNAMLVMDDQFRLVLVNRNAEAMFGYGREELIGQEVHLLVPDRIRERHKVYVKDFLVAPAARSMGGGRELYGRRKDGSEIPLEIGLNPIDAPDGFFVLAVVIDISERLRAEAATQRLAAIVEGSDDAIFSRNLEGVITSWNQGAERLYGYTAAEAIGQLSTLLVPERMLEQEQDPSLRIGSRETTEHFETVRKRKDGSEIYVSLRISPVRDSSGLLVGDSKIARDITEAKRRDAELKRSNAELEQFAYVASHDLQEPLRMVSNYTELLAKRYQGQLDDRADKYIHYAVDGARRMQRLVADLLAYSRIGSQAKPLMTTDSRVVWEEVVKSLRPLIRESKATVQLGELPVVSADEGQLRQLFQNLLSNALKFRDEAPPEIKIQAVEEADQWTFSVQDNGIGIDPQYAERVFQMFQRLHPVGSFEGSGIGLCISKRIVERHSGRIWFEPAPEQGTIFYFTHPKVSNLTS